MAHGPHTPTSLNVAGLFLVAALVAWAASSASAQCPPNGYVATQFPIGPNPHDILAGDFDGDGILDLAVAVAAANQVAILRGLGSGSFAGPSLISVSPRPNCLASGDFDEDGTLDLVVGCDGNNKIAVLRSPGSACNGGEPASPTYFAAGLAPFRIATGDFNADGITDLAVANNSVANASILLGIGSGGVGDGSFGPPAFYPTGANPSGAVVADLNLDEILDVAISNYGPGNVSILRGKGDGTFHPAVQVPVGTHPFNLASGDFNEDGIVDLVTANAENGTVSVLLGVLIGVGGVAYARVDYAAGANTSGLAIADIDGDAITDILVTLHDIDSLAVLQGQGSAGHGDGTFALCAKHPTGDVALAISVGDFTADGVPDVATADYGGGTITRLLSQDPIVPTVSISGSAPPLGLDTTSAQMVTVTGAGFQLGATVRLVMCTSARTATNVIVDPSGTELTAVFDLRGAERGHWMLEVQNPDASFSTLPNACRIDWVPVPLTILPASGPDVRIQAVTITGTRFDPGAQLELYRDGGAFVAATGEGVLVDGTTLVGALDLRNLANGPWHVRIHNGQNTASGVLLDAFLVVPAPQVTGVSPAEAPSEPGVDVTVSGTGFQEGAQVILEQTGQQAGLPGVEGTEEATSPDGTQITVRFDLSGQAGFRNVLVVNPDSASGRLVNGFHIIGTVAVGAPATALALRGSWPNPAGRDLVVEFSLPDARAATLELVDLNGRILARTNVGAFGVGHHSVALGQDLQLAAGIYVVRLRRGGQSLTSKVTVLQ